MDYSLNIFGCKGDRLAKLTDETKYEQFHFWFLLVRRSRDVLYRITATQAVTCSHPSIVERAASGNGSGYCVLWAPPDLDDAE